MTRWHQVYWLPDDACSVQGKEVFFRQCLALYINLQTFIFQGGVGSGSGTVTLTDMQFSFYVFGVGKSKMSACVRYVNYFCSFVLLYV